MKLGRRTFLQVSGGAVAVAVAGRGVASASAAQLVSLNKPTSASDSEAGHLPQYANDSDASNDLYWSAILSPAGNAWWQVDLQNTYRISMVNVRNWVDGSRYYQYQVRGSLDGINFFPLALKASPTAATDPGDAFAVDAVVRYVRVDLYHNSANNAVHLTDVRVYGAAATVPVAAPVQTRCELIPGGLFVPGDAVTVAVTLTNPGRTAITLSNVVAETVGLTDPLATRGTVSLGSVTIPPGQSQRLVGTLQNITAGTTSGAYAVYLNYTADVPWSGFATFFRAGQPGDLTTYSTKRFTYKGIPVYALEGGLSTEFNVEKAAEGLTAGVSHSWYTQGDAATEPPVWATPHFLRDSLRTTVKFWDDLLGSRAEIDTVIIGIFSVGHIPRSLKAVWLPAHFLVTTTTIQEVAAVLDQAAADGYPATATTGPDGSVPGYVASWINVLGLPAEYAEFIKKHGVKNVVLVGGDGQPAWGAPQVMRDGTVHGSRGPGDISVLPTLGPLDAWAKDYADWPISDPVDTADWEVAFVKEAVSGIAADVKPLGARTILVAGDKNANMFEIESAAALAFMKKNESVFTEGGTKPAVRGIVTNSYLLSHPFYESRIGYVPYYFGSYNTQDAIDLRLLQHLSGYIAHYFGAMDITTLPLWFDAAHNMDAANAIAALVPYLQEKGFTVTIPDYSSNEVWDPSDGMNAPVEQIAQKLAALGANSVRRWNDQLQPIGLPELQEMATLVPGLTVTVLD